MSKRLQILVCDGPSCGLCFDSEALVERMQTRIEANPALDGRVFVVEFTCFGRCGEGPNMLVRELGANEQGDGDPPFDELSGVHGFYPGVDAPLADRILDEHCVGGEPLAGLAERY